MARAATILVDQQPNGLNGFNITNYRAADDFILNDAFTVGAMRFWADSPLGNVLAAGTYSWAIYQDSAGSLGSVVDSGSTSAVTVTDTGVPGFTERYQLDFTIDPLNLAGGHYWIEFHYGPTLSTVSGNFLYWDSAAANNLNARWNYPSGAGLPTVAMDPVTGLAFQLFGSAQTAVPEPGSMGLMALGLISVLASARYTLRSNASATRNMVVSLK